MTPLDAANIRHQMFLTWMNAARHKCFLWTSNQTKDAYHVVHREICDCLLHAANVIGVIASWDVSVGVDANSKRYAWMHPISDCAIDMLELEEELDAYDAFERSYAGTHIATLRKMQSISMMPINQEVSMGTGDDS